MAFTDQKQIPLPLLDDNFEENLPEHGKSSPTKNTSPQILTVSNLNKAIRGHLENGFALVWLKGELSNFKAHSSGHWYFSLKDNKAQINAIMFRGFNQSVKIKPLDGLEVIVRGKITVYEPRGTYQIFCELMESVGAGAMQAAFEKLKIKLESEGLFSQNKKKPLPLLPQHVAVVTSPTGAAIRDILQVLNRRFKGLKVTIVPVLVQGEQAANSIVKGLAQTQKMKDVDVVILGRGGGSAEDMWCFNDEGVARAIAASSLPIVSAVGHEIDFTIADFVADVRAPTPSAAAEMIVKSAFELQEKLRLQFQHLCRLLRHKLELFNRQIQGISQRLVDPKRRLMDLALRCDELQNRMTLAMQFQLKTSQQRIVLLKYRMGSPLEQVSQRRQQLGEMQLRLTSGMKVLHERKSARWGQAMALLDSLSPLRVLERGYAIVHNGNQVVRDANEVELLSELTVKFHRGEVVVVTKKIIN
ncbi:MAG: exodeoxyribonuclease VII large subunit [Bdellovibrionales bacterium]|nr:exodeoxyribonuclease VII large subunit [Bdellovibrionales bacterium]